jgi:hypothetical protein
MINMVSGFYTDDFTSFFFDYVVFNGIYIGNRHIACKTIMYSLSLVLGLLITCEKNIDHLKMRGYRYIGNRKERNKFKPDCGI